MTNKIRVTTTHAGYGEGHPRLKLASVHSDESPRGDEGEEYQLTAEHTLIGSGPEVDIHLDGLDTVHAEIRHTRQDEYVLLLHGVGETSFYANTTLPGGELGYLLRTGYRFELGPHVLSFLRDEYADHGRPFGGRTGGEFSHQQTQSPQPGQEAVGERPSYDIEQAADGEG